MMDLFLEHPLAALAVVLAAFPAALLLGRRFFLPRLALPFRILLLLTAAAAAAGPSAILPGASPRLVYLVDESPSMAGYLPALSRKVADEIASLPSSVRADVLGFCASVREAAVSLRGGDRPSLRFRASSGRGFDFASALKAAWFRIPAGEPGLVVLFTDGDFDRSALPLPPPGVEVVVRALPPVTVDDTAVSNLLFPERIPAGEPVTARVTISANRPGRAALELLCDGRTLASVSVETDKGTVEKAIPVRFSAPGLRTVLARVTTEMPDSFPGNDYLERTVLVTGPPKVAVFCPDEGERARWLELLGGRAETPIGRFDPFSYSGVLLADLPAAEVPEGLERFVKLGGGVFIAGGSAAFDDGYRRGGLKRISPFEPDPTGGKRVDILLLIDKSGSLDRPAPGSGLTCFQLLKNAVIASMELAGPAARIGCVAFDARPHLLFPLTSLRSPEERMEAQRKVAALRAEGGTDLSAALEKAAKILKADGADVKHLVVFHDGETVPGNYLETFRALASAGVKVHLVAVGRVNKRVMEEIREAARASLTVFGENDWADFPRRFRRMLDQLKGERVKKGPFSVSLAPAASVSLGVEGSLPPVGAVAAVRLAEDCPLFASCRPLGLPLAAGRIHGAGRCAAFASSLTWSPAWRKGAGADFLKALLEWTFDTSRLARASLSLEERGDALILTALLTEPDGSPALGRKVFARLHLPNGEKRVKLLSYAAGRYRCRLVGLSIPEAVTAVLEVDGREAGVFPLAPAGAGERAAGAFEPQALEALASALGGRYCSGSLRPERDLPGRRSLLPFLGLLFCLLLLAERAACLPALSRALRSLSRGSHGRP